MALSQDAKNYGNRPRLRGKHMRTGPLADIIREIGSPGLSTLSANFTFADFTAEAGTDTVTLPALPKGAEILKVMINLKTLFAGNGSQTTLKLGDGTTAAAFGRELDVEAGGNISIGRHIWTKDDDQGPDEIDISTSEMGLVITCTVSGGDCDEMTAGEFSISVLYAVMPT